MLIKRANNCDTHVIHDLMRQAFSPYLEDEFPSSALEETIASINDARKQGEQAFICYKGATPIGMVRFQKGKDSLYFYRLSVIPTEQGKGIAKRIVAHLESYSKEEGIVTIYCKVRKAEENNINLYRSIGYEQYETTMLDRKEGKMEIVSMKKQF